MVRSEGGRICWDFNDLQRMAAESGAFQRLRYLSRWSLKETTTNHATQADPAPTTAATAHSLHPSSLVRLDYGSDKFTCLPAQKMPKPTDLGTPQLIERHPSLQTARIRGKEMHRRHTAFEGRCAPIFTSLLRQQIGKTSARMVSTADGKTLCTHLRALPSAGNGRGSPPSPECTLMNKKVVDDDPLCADSTT